MAEFCSVGDTVDAAPDDFLSAVNIPSHALIRTAAFPTVQPFGKGVLAVVPPALLFASVRAGLAVAAGDFSLHLAVHAHPIPTDVLISIAELFGVSLDVLLDLEKPTCVSTQGLSISQIEVVEALVQEFRSPTSTGSDFSEAKMKILHDIFDNFCEPK